MTIKKIHLTILLSICILTGSKNLIGQNSTNSPYSRFGIGMLDNQRTNVISNNMGGVGIGLYSNSFINTTNPASYAAFDTLSFHFDGGLSASIQQFKDANGSFSANVGSIDYMTFGFPINKWLRTSFGLLPISNMTYDVSSVRTLEENNSTFSQIYNGNGGLNQVYLGAGIKITPRLFAGFNANYIFGSIQRNRIIDLGNNADTYSSKVSEKIKASDYSFDFGLQYFHPINKDIKMGVGLTFSPQSNISAKRDKYAYTYQFNVENGLEMNQDTVLNLAEEAGDIKFPYSIGTGVSFENPGKWMIGSDFTYANWEAYESFNAKDPNIQNSWKIALGGYWVPDNRSIASFWKRTIYRMGFRYGDSYYHVNGTSITEYGLNFGVSFPFRKTGSSINLGFEYGGLGKAVDNLVKENYFKFRLGISINERWFVKYRYK